MHMISKTNGIVSSQFKDYFEALNYLGNKARQVEKIEAHPYHPKDFINEDPLVWEIKKTGIKILK